MQTYSFTTLDGPSANGINNSDEIRGNYGFWQQRWQAFLFGGSTGSWTTLNLPGDFNVAALGINDTGQIVGQYQILIGPPTGFLYSGGTFTTIFDRDHFSFEYGSVAAGINDSGKIVGTNSQSAFLYSSGTFTYFIDPSNKSHATGINNVDQIVGYYVDGSNISHGFLYSGGTYSTLDDPLGAGGTYATGINDAGQVVGYYIDGSGKNNGFLYNGTTYTTIDDPLGINGTVINGINDAGKIVGSYTDATGSHAFFADTSGTSTVTVQFEHFAITRTALPLDQATTIANSINAGTLSQSQFVNSLFLQIADTTIPAVAVEGSMYGAVGISVEVTALTTQYLPAQIAFATQHGFDPLVFACEVLGVVFAFNNETSSTAFATTFGPTHAGMPNLAAGDAAFAAAAASSIFGSASTPNLVSAMESYISNWKAFFTNNGLHGNGDQVDLAARGTAWGDLVGVALANPNLSPLTGQTINFIDDAAQGIAIYSASLSSQPAHAQFPDSATASVATTGSHVQLTGVAAPIDHVIM